MMKLSLVMVLLLFVCQATATTANTIDVSSSRSTKLIPKTTIPPRAEIVGQYYRDRYKLQNATAKLVNDKGNGFDALYGVRNFRAVLNGIYYRGGANNLYNKNGKRDNMNPLPNEALDHLCQEGFSQSIYLYPTNYGSAPKVSDCRKSQDSSVNRLEYLQLSSLSENTENIHRILAFVHEHIMNPELGPIYAHCWNGWHASGFAAAAALRQFCGFSGEQAVKYWNLNTDGAFNGYDSVRKRIRDFVPYPELNIQEEVKTAICPDRASLTFLNPKRY